MAKAKDSKDTSKEGVISEKHKQFNSFLNIAVNKRKVSSFWDGGDWEDRWELQDEYALPKQEVKDQTRGFRSHEKSPEVVARNQSTMQKLYKLNVGFTVRPVSKHAKFAAQIDQEILNYYFKTNQFRQSLDEAFQLAIQNGTAPIGVEWLKKVRSVHMPISDASQMDEDQKAMVKKGEVPYAKMDLVDFRGPVLLTYPLRSVYVDPSASNIQGVYRNADYVFVAELIPFESFKAEFKSKSGYKNIDKVEPITSGYQSQEGATPAKDSFMAPPVDGDGEYVYLVKGWCYSKDWYMVRANDVFIKEDYLPYADKKIPIELLKPFTYPHQLYGIAPTDLLIPTVYQIELMLNALFDYAIYTTNPILLVDKYDYGDFSRKYEVVDGEPGALLPVSNTVGSVKALQFPNLTVDIYQGLEKLQRDAVIATQHDPSQLGFMKKDATATANIMNKEVLDAYIGALLHNFQGSLENIARMVISRIHQFMKKGDVTKIVNGEGEMEPFEIPIVGKAMDIDWDERVINIEEDANRVTVIKVSDKIYKYQDEETGEEIEVTPNDYDIHISSESKEIISEALEKQKIMEAFGQLAPYAVNPANPEMAMQHPMGLINGQVLLQELVEKLGLPVSLLVSPTENEKKDLQRAEEQNMSMFAGERVMPQAGESGAHVEHHARFLRQLQNLHDNMIQDLKSTIMSGGQPEQEAQMQFDKVKVAMGLLAEHMDYDTTPVLMESKRAQSEAMQSVAPQPQQAGPMSQGVAPVGMGGDQSAPNVPQAAGMAQGGMGNMPPM